MNFSIILLVLLLPTPLWVILIYKYFQNKKSEKNTRLTELERKSEYIQSVIDKLDDSSTNANKLITIKKALIVLEDCETYEECRKVIQNYDELKNHLHSLQKEYQI
jgi:chromosome segregation ATPase